jgi:hypothetical protein
LDKISADIFIIAQVAELASEADQLADVANREHETINEAVTKRNLGGTLNDFVKWGSIADLGVSDGLDDVSQEGHADTNIDVADEPSVEVDEDDSLTTSGGDAGNGDSDTDSDKDDEKDTGSDKVKADNKASSRYSVASSRTTKTLKSLLDRWEEPISKDDVSWRKIASFIVKICPVQRVLMLNQCQPPYRRRMSRFRISSAFANGFHTWYGR